MKKLFLSLVLLITIGCSVWAVNKVNFVKEYDGIPVELRGVWYSLNFSMDEGETEDTQYRPLFIASRVILATTYYSDRIMKTELYEHTYGPSYLLYSEEEGTVYLVVFYKELPDTPVVYMYKSGKEQFRSCVKIVKL